MNIINISEVKLLKLPKRDAKILVGGNSPVKSDYMTFGVTFVKPKTKMDYHIHKKEEEIIYIVNGEGYVDINGKRESIRKGTVIRIPIGSKHLIINNSKDTMEFVFCFNSKISIGSYDKK